MVVYALPPLSGEGVGKTVTLTVLPSQRTMLTCKYSLPERQDARERQLRLLFLRGSPFSASHMIEA